MAWKKVDSGAIGLKGKEVGTVWEGLYRGKKVVPSGLDPSKNQNIWQFIDETEKPFEMWGCASLDMQMNNVVPESLVRITYEGTVKKKGKDCHVVTVEVNSEE